MGEIVGIALRGVRASDVKRGSVLCAKAIPSEAIATRRFTARIRQLGAPLRVGASLFCFCHVASFAATLAALDGDEAVFETQTRVCVQPFRTQPALGRFAATAGADIRLVGVVLRLGGDVAAAQRHDHVI